MRQKNFIRILELWNHCRHHNKQIVIDNYLPANVTFGTAETNGFNEQSSACNKFRYKFSFNDFSYFKIFIKKRNKVPKYAIFLTFSYNLILPFDHFIFQPHHSQPHSFRCFRKYCHFWLIYITVFAHCDALCSTISNNNMIDIWWLFASVRSSL